MPAGSQPDTELAHDSASTYLQDSPWTAQRGLFVVILCPVTMSLLWEEVLLRCAIGMMV